MANKIYVDRILVHYGEELLWDEKKPRVLKPSPNKLTLNFPKSSGNDQVNAERVRQHIGSLIRKAPQVMVKITGGGADMKKIASHIDYITRGGKYKSKNEPELEIHTDDGQTIQGKEARQWLKDMFANSGTPIPQEVHELRTDSKLMQRKRREALNIILSMPHGINRKLVQSAAGATAAKLFGANHLYAFVHHEDTDHQHTHIVVKSIGHDGKRLNPRKADLENWRTAFAQELNARGIDAIATRRRVRLQRIKGESQAVRQIKDRGQTPKRLATSQTQDKAQSKAIINETKVIRAYSEMAKALAQSELKPDRQLASGLKAFLKEQGVKLSKSINPSLG